MRSPDGKFTSEDYTDEHADVFAARYDDGLRDIKVDRVRRFLGNVCHKDVLDLGCGVGYFASLATDLGANAVACDFAESMVTRARQRYGSKFPLIRASVETPPFRAGSFDLVLALDVIEHLYRPVQMLQAVNRLLRPGGHLIITTDRVGFQIGRLPKYAAKVFAGTLRSVDFRRTAPSSRSKYQTPLCTHVHEYYMQELIDVVENAGFRLINSDTFPNRTAFGATGRLVEVLGRGALKKYKWDQCIYRFTRISRDDGASFSEQNVSPGSSRSVKTKMVLPITWTNLPCWAYRTAGSSWLTYRSKRRSMSVRRLWRSLMPNLRRPIILVGAPRSGTTFLGSCLAELPEVSYHFEPVATKAAARYIYDGRWGTTKAKWFYRSVYRWVMRVHLDGDLRFAEKTPRNCFLIPFLSRCFPDAQFVHIIRDGRDAALSLAEKPWLRESQRDSGQREPGGYPHGPYARFWVEPERVGEFEAASDIRRCIWAWRRHTEAALEGCAKLDSARYHELRYEKLVASRKDEAERLLDFLQIERRASRDVFHAAVAKVRPDSVGRWKLELSDQQREQIEAEAGGLLRRLCYGCQGNGADAGEHS